LVNKHLTTTIIATTLACFAAIVPSSAAAGTVAGITLDGPVDPASQEYLTRAIRTANEGNHQLILIRVNTPGGLVDSMEDISKSILGSRIPVAVWVGPHGARAASAGFILLMTSDVAAMSQGTRTGAAHPIMAIGGLFPIGDQQQETESEPAAETAPPADPSAVEPTGVPGQSAPEEPAGAERVTPVTPPAPTRAPDPAKMGSVLMEKVGNDMKAFIRSITEARGRNPSQAVLAVSVSKSWSESEALKAGLIDVVASDEADLLKQLQGRQVKRIDGNVVTLNPDGATIVEIEMTGRERILRHVVDPNVAFILLLLGILLIYIEVTHFGLIIPGVTGLACLAVSVSGLSLLPLNSAGVLMILAGIGLLIAEAFVTSYGLLGLLGVVTMAIGGIILVDLPRIEGIALDPVIAISAAVGFGLIVLVLVKLVVKAVRARPSTGAESLVGREAVAVRTFQGPGSVMVHGEYWSASCDTLVAKGATVRIIAVDGLNLVVEPVETIS